VTAGSAIVLDVDGTLVDSVYLHTVCWWRAFRQHRIDVPMVDIHRAVGMGADHLVPHVAGPVEAETAAAVTDEHGRLWRVYRRQVRPTRGAELLLREAARLGLAVVLASSASPDDLAAMRTTLACDDVVSAAVSSADVDASKPEPDIVALALARVRVAPADALMVGDSVWDGVAARRVGATFLAVLTGGTSAVELTNAGARAVYADPAELSADLVRWADPPLLADRARRWRASGPKLSWMNAGPGSQFYVPSTPSDVTVSVVPGARPATGAPGPLYDVSRV
jgi:phosphoglycolate phosphatase-like HAD superfamily hydrolase